MHKWYLRRIRLNNGGYTDRGHYYGIGAPLYQAIRVCDDKVVMIRAGGRKQAAIELRRQFPGAKFFVESRNRLTQTQQTQRGE